MDASELRRAIGNKPYGTYGFQIPEDVLDFLKQISERSPENWGRYAYQVVQDMTDEELLARWARFIIERSSEI